MLAGLRPTLGTSTFPPLGAHLGPKALWDHHHGTATMALPPWDCHHGTATTGLPPNHWYIAWAAALSPWPPLAHQDALYTETVWALETSAQSPPCTPHRRPREPSPWPQGWGVGGQSHLHFKGCPVDRHRSLQQHPQNSPTLETPKCQLPNVHGGRNDCSPHPHCCPHVTLQDGARCER